MPVMLNIPVTPPAPVYDKVHMDNLVITSQQTDYAKTSVSARIRLYYQDPVTGIKTFSPEAQDIQIDDAEQWATQLAMQGNMGGVSAAQKIKDILALIVNTCTTYGATTVV